MLKIFRELPPTVEDHLSITTSQDITANSTNWSNEQNEQIKMLSKENEDLRAQINSQNQEILDLKIMHRNEMSRKKDELKLFEEQSKKSLDQQSQKIDQLQVSLQKAQQEKEKVYLDGKEGKNMIKELNGHIEELTQQQVILVNEKEEMEQKQKDFSLQNDRLFNIISNFDSNFIKTPNFDFCEFFERSLTDLNDIKNEKKICEEKSRGMEILFEEETKKYQETILELQKQSQMYENSLTQSKSLSDTLIEEIQKENTKLKDIIKNSEISITTLNEMLNQSNEELKTVKKDLVEMEKSLKEEIQKAQQAWEEKEIEYEKSISQQQSEISTLLSQLADSKKDLISLQQLYEEENMKWEIKEKEFQNDLLQNSRMEAKIAEMTVKIEQYSENERKLKEDYHQLEDKFQNMSREYEILSVANEDLIKKGIQVQNREKDYLADIGELQTKIRNQTRELEQSILNKQKWEDEHDQLTKTIRDMTEELNNLKQEKGDVHNQQIEAQQRISALENQIRAAENDRMKMLSMKDEELTTLQMRLDGIINQNKSKLENLQQDYEQKMDIMTNSIAEEKSNLLTSLQASEKLVEKYKEKYLQHQHSNHRKDQCKLKQNVLFSIIIEYLQRQLATTQKEKEFVQDIHLPDLQNKIKEKQCQLDEKDCLLTSKDDHIDSQKQTIVNMQTELAKLQGQIDNLMTSLSESETIISTLQAESEQAQQERLDLESDLDEKISQLNEIQNELENLRQLALKAVGPNSNETEVK